MSLSRREFARTLGIGGAGVLSADFISGRGFEHLMAMGLPQQRREPRGADAIVISSNENPRGPAASALDVLRGRANYRGGGTRTTSARSRTRSPRCTARRRRTC